MDASVAVLYFSGVGSITMAGYRIPVFDLYEAPDRDGVPGFLHAERIRLRAGMHGWSIAAHRHRDLYQAFLVTSGGGRLDVDARTETFAAPHLLWIPAGIAHGFRFEPDTDGHVVTVAADFLDEALGRSVAREVAPARDRLVVARPDPADGLAEVFVTIEAEIAGGRPGARLAIAAALDRILVALARIGDIRAASEDEAGLALMRRFRSRVEARFRDHDRIADYAAALGVTTDRLHDVAVRLAGRNPQALLHERLILEAKRSLVYTGATVAEIGFELGFRDPAYFSRFFAARVGRSPGAFRRAPQQAADRTEERPGG